MSSQVGVDVDSESSNARAGERVLAVLSTPLNFRVLQALSKHPMRLAELRRATGLPAQTTLRGHLTSLGEFGVVSKRPTAQMPYAVENELTPMGHEMLRVADLLESWLQRAPDGAISLETGGARGVVKAFIDGWSSTMMGGLAVRPMSLTELDRQILDLSYPALERRLSSMRMAGLIEARPAPGGGTPYAMTEWARFGVLPLAAASSCERSHIGELAAPVTREDIEAAFMLATPLVGLSADAQGVCQLEVEADPYQPREAAGVQVVVERGRIVSCDAILRVDPGDYARGSVASWFKAIVDGAVDLLSFGGDGRLPKAIVGGLHAALMTR